MKAQDIIAIIEKADSLEAISQFATDSRKSVIEAFSKATERLNVKQEVEEARTEEESEMLTVVYPFIQSEAKGKELIYSLRSLEKHLKTPFQVVIIGNTPSYLNDLEVILINQKRLSTNPQLDVLEKRRTIVQDDRVGEKILWMNDDIYLINDVTLEDLAIPVFVGEMKERSDTLNQFAKNKNKTMKALSKIDKAKLNFSNHTPNLFEKSKIIELFEKFEDSDMLTFNDFYFNYYSEELPEPVLTNHADFKIGIYRNEPNWDMFIKLEKTAKFLNHGSSNFIPKLIQYFAKKFPTKSRFEV